MIKRYEKLKSFVQDHIWKMQVKDESWTSFFIRQLRILVLAFRGFFENNVNLRASALTFYTLLSVVPILAMAFAIAKGFGFEKSLEDLIIENFRGQEEVMNRMIEYSNNLLSTAKGGVLAGIGTVVLLWSVMQVLTNIENSFNAIWKIKNSRPFARKLSDYLAMMLIGPILILASSSIIVYISTRLETAAQRIEVIDNVSTFIDPIVGFIPYLIIWLLFTLVYLIMPNTKVKFIHALVAGIIAGTIFQLVQWLYIHFQVGVSRYNAIYGTFAALPLFLVWLQVSWLIVLLGAELSYAYQNVGKYEYEAGDTTLSIHQRRFIALFLTHHIVNRFASGKESETSDQMNEELGIPLRMVRDTLYQLVRAKVLTETATDDPKITAYQPAVDPSLIDVSFVIGKFDNMDEGKLIINPEKLDENESRDFNNISKIHDDIFKKIKSSNINVLLKDI